VDSGQREKQVLLIYHPFNIYYDGKGGVFHFPSCHLPYDSEEWFWNDSLWCLFDAKDKGKGKLEDLPYDLCTFVLSTSPRRDLVNDFQKPPLPQVFYMPVWDKAELRKVALVLSTGSTEERQLMARPFQNPWWNSSM
jgi:hypothetical protein